MCIKMKYLFSYFQWLERFNLGLGSSVKLQSEAFVTYVCELPSSVATINSAI